MLLLQFKEQEIRKICLKIGYVKILLWKAKYVFTLSQGTNEFYPPMFELQIPR